MTAEQVSPQKVSEFYDQFSDYQKRTGLNLRHYKIFRELLRSGLQKDHRVLEIGCGIGQMTYLLATFLKKGNVTSTDISHQNVEIAKRRLKRFNNVHLMLSDMPDLPTAEKFDYVLLPDVLEHIPIERHPELFEVLGSHLHEDSKVLIHIPHPTQIEYLQRTNPEVLQIVDQSIHTDVLLQNAYRVGLRLHSLNSYSLFSVLPDYQFIILISNKTYSHNPPRSKLGEYLRRKMLKLHFIYSTLIA